jgi:hypothetical protein
MIGGRSPAWPRERSEWPKKQPALSVRPLPAARRQVTTKPRSRRTRRDSAWTREKRHFRGDVADPETRFLGLGKPGRREQPAHESLSSRATLVEVPLTGLSFCERYGCSGTPGRDRTCDLRFRKPSLYPLSYGGGCVFPRKKTVFALGVYGRGRGSTRIPEMLPKLDSREFAGDRMPRPVNSSIASDKKLLYQRPESREPACRQRNRCCNGSQYCL